MKILKIETVVAIGLLIFAANASAEKKVDKNVKYGPHERNVLDVYWNTEYKNAPIVFTIHGGSFKKGDKRYCNKNRQDLYMAKECIVVSPNYRFKKPSGPNPLFDCTIDCAMAVAYIQANAKKYGGDAEKIVATGASAGGYLSFQVAYNKVWKWPTYAKYKPKKLNVIGWFGNSPYVPPHVAKNVASGDAPGFFMYGGKKEHPATPAKQGHDLQALFKSKRVWSTMVDIPAMGHVPGGKVLFSPRSRDKATYEAYNAFLDMVCHSKRTPKGGDVITVVKKGRDVVTIPEVDRGAAAPVRKGYHLFILSGQSNMVAMDPKVSFTPAIHKGFGADKVIIVKKAWGGCPISQWYKQWKPKPNAALAKGNGKYYDELMVDVKKAIKGKKLATVTLVWMQGEFDANRGRHNAYKASLAGLVKQFSDDMERDDLNFVIGRLSDCGLRGGGAPKWKIVREAQVAVAEESPRGEWIDTDDMNGPRDGLHMTPEGYAEMGKRFAGKAIELIKGK